MKSMVEDAQKSGRAKTLLEGIGNYPISAVLISIAVPLPREPQ